MSAANSNVVAVLTPPGAGAIAVVWAAGPKAAEVLADRFEPAKPFSTGSMPLARHCFGNWRHDDGREDVVVVRKSTNEFEICTHGGSVSPRLVIAAFEQHGFEPIEPGDYVARQIRDRWQATARQAVLKARTLRAAQRLLDADDGRLPKMLSAIRSHLANGQSELAVPLLAQLADSYEFGRQLIEGWRVSIVGATNVGKSTLLNQLVGFARSIVIDQPGATRDVVSEVSAVDGWPVQFSDTAGLRESVDPLERQGIEKTRQSLQTADLVLLVTDCSQPWSAVETELMNAHPNVAVIHNKSDLPPSAGDRPAGTTISLLRDEAPQVILSIVSDRVFRDLPANDLPIITELWQRNAVESALKAIRAGDCKQAALLLASE